MTVNANMNISGTSILVAQTGSGGLPSLLTHNAGTITSGSVTIGSGNGTYRMAGGTLTSSGNLTLNPGAGF